MDPAEEGTASLSGMAGSSPAMTLKVERRLQTVAVFRIQLSNNPRLRSSSYAGHGD